MRAVFCALLALGLNCSIIPSTRAANTFTVTGSMSAAREPHTATLLPNGNVLVAGGTGTSFYGLSSAELYDPGIEIWVPTGAMNAARAGHTATLLHNGKVLVTGGFDYQPGPGGSILSSAELYDPATETWATTGLMRIPHEFHTATLLPNGKVLVAGGYNDSGYRGLTSAELYDPATGTWTATDSTSAPRSAGHTATLLPNGKVLLTGGLDIDADTGYFTLSSAELYDPATGTWVPTGAMSAPRAGHTATLLHNGKVLVSGGIDIEGNSGTTLSSAELYDPATGTWAPTGAMNTGLSSLTATLLPNGNVLVAMGINSDGTVLSSAELYDPATGTWATTGAMSAPREGHTATLLHNGKVLFAGGDDGTTVISSAELYSTPTNWTPLPTAPGPIGLMILQSDGTVLAHNADGATPSNTWYRLKPDSYGHYVSGTWDNIGPFTTMNDTRLFYSSQILKDGRLFVAGGEYPENGTGGENAEVYNPVNNEWTPAPASGHTFSDSNSAILPDGRVLVALVEGTLRSTIIFDPVANDWNAGPTCLGIHNECTWVKLPDDSILMVDRDSTSSERYIPSLNQWVADATVPVSLYDSFDHECGAAFLLPNGKAIFFGSLGLTAIYTPSGTNAPGTWIAGPYIAVGAGTADAPAAILPDGKILCAVSPIPKKNDDYPSPTFFCQYDYVTNIFTLESTPTSDTINHPAYQGTMLVLPDGTALYSDFTNQIYSYQPRGTPLAAGKPTISGITANADGSFHLSGTQLNGISEGSCYGDDNQNSTNYPIVRLTSGSGTVYYARSYNWSSTGVRTGANPVTTEFAVLGVPVGIYSVSVIANGIASDPVSLTIAVATLAATFSASNSATLNGTVNANGSSTAVSFDYGTSIAYGTNIPGTPSLITGSSATAVSANLSGLTAGTTYHFRIKAVSAAGTVYGPDQMFTTLTSIESWRQQYFGTTVNIGNAADTADPDRDGFTNLFEFTAGLIPNDATSRFRSSVEAVSGQPGHKAIIFSPLVVGRTYVVKYKASLGDATWTNLTNITTSDSGAERTVIDLLAVSGLRFYHVEITLP